MSYSGVGLVLLMVTTLVACKSTSEKEKTVTPMEAQDPYLWLEEVESPKALEFAKAENKRSLEHFKSNPLFNSIESDIRKIFLAKDRVPAVSLKNGELFNYWQDSKSVRGVWRKTFLQSYKTAAPVWEVILDLDALAKTENENWVWKGAQTLPPKHERALIYLSRGGKDASVVREFDLKTKKFVKDGFNVPEAKSRVSWIDENTVFVGTDFGPGTVTNSGYPRISKLWKRGTPLASAETKITGAVTDMSASSYADISSEGTYRLHNIAHTFYEGENWIEDEKGASILLPMPQDAEYRGIFKKHVLYSLRSNLKNFKAGSLVALPLDKISSGAKAQDSLQLIFAPTAKKFVSEIGITKDYLLLQGIDNVLNCIDKVTFTAPNTWQIQPVSLGQNGMANISSTEDESDTYLAQYVDFLTPTSTFVGNAADPSNKFELLKQSPVRFDSKDLKVQRFEATSEDGTKIPYFVVAKNNLQLDGKNPTLLYGYGGFEIAMQPSYLSFIGKVWAEKGGVYVLSNLRGGGEFGPEWHKSVLKENRYKIYEDNIAIAEDLIARKITSPEHLGISGRSNGGLLTGATFTLRPDLFNAVIVGVPLLDMLRFHKLLAGASWVAEYGNPEDPKMREAILKYSPYQRLSPAVKYPEVFIMTSTKDDRVHPGHARKMVAKMREQGHPGYYYENTEGGHAGSSNLEQAILWNTLEYVYLWEKLK
jgi:prolyl oligopeptidase